MPAPAPSNPLPVQYTSFKKEDLQTDAGVHFLNLFLSQLTTSHNSLVGAGGPAILPAGIDVRGATISGIGPPASPTDAIPAGHADTQYGYEAQQQQLDVGKPYALRGLSYAYGASFANSQAITAIQALLPATPYAGGQSFTIAGLIIKLGHTSTFSGSQAVTFTTAFPTACVAAFAVDDYASAAQRQMSVNQATVGTGGFTIQSSGAGNGAYWLAVGY